MFESLSTFVLWLYVYAFSLFGFVAVLETHVERSQLKHRPVKRQHVVLMLGLASLVVIALYQIYKS